MKSTFNALLLAAAAVVFLPCLFAHPIADDFDFASNTRQSGLFHAWKQQYLTWNGRYTSNALALATPLTVRSNSGYRAAIAAMIVAEAIALFVLLRTLAGHLFTRSEVVAAVLGFGAIFYSQMPSIGEGVYWYTGAATYQAAWVVMLLQLASVVRYLRSGRRLALALATALLVVAIGFNEAMLVIVLLLYAVLSGLSMSGEIAGRRTFPALLTIALVCAGVVVLSPGNALREAVYPARHQLARSLTMTAAQTVRFLADWVTSAPLLVASILWVANTARLAVVSDPARARRHLRLCVAGMLLVVPAAVFPAYWATGMLGQQRTVNTAYFAFLMLWFTALASAEARGCAATAAMRAFGGQTRTLLVPLFLISIALTHNSARIVQDLVTGRFAAFDREMTARERALQACRQSRRAACDVEAIHTIPSSFLVLDLANDPHDWVNIAHARFFDVGEVRRRPLPADGSSSLEP